MQHEIAEAYFNEPVDAEALGIPEYRRIITVSTICTLSHGYTWHTQKETKQHSHAFICIQSIAVTMPCAQVTNIPANKMLIIAWSCICSHHIGLRVGAEQTC